MRYILPLLLVLTVMAFRPPTKNIRNFTFSSANTNDSIPVIRNSDRLITVGGVVDLADVDSVKRQSDSLKLYNNGIPLSVRLGNVPTIDTLYFTGSDSLNPIDNTLYIITNLPTNDSIYLPDTTDANLVFFIQSMTGANYFIYGQFDGGAKSRVVGPGTTCRQYFFDPTWKWIDF